MLRWDMYIYDKTINNKSEAMLASWLTDDGELDWIKKLLVEGKAKALPGEEFPLVYFVPASILLPGLYQRLSNDSKAKDGEVLLPPLPVTLEINAANIFLCKNTDELAIEVWSNQQAYLS